MAYDASRVETCAMPALRFLVLAATLLLGGTAVAQTGQTPPPGRTPSFGKTLVPGLPPGFTPGQTFPPSLQRHAPVCPNEAHIRLPANYTVPTTVYGNCSDPDGAAATGRLVYSTPNVFPQHTFMGLGDQASDSVTFVTLKPHPGYVGPDFMQYYAIDGDKRTASNTTDFYIDIVAGLKAPSAVWTGTSRPDEIEGTALADSITTY